MTPEITTYNRHPISPPKLCATAIMHSTTPQMTMFTARTLGIGNLCISRFWGYWPMRKPSPVVQLVAQLWRHTENAAQPGKLPSREVVVLHESHDCRVAHTDFVELASAGACPAKLTNWRQKMTNMAGRTMASILRRIRLSSSGLTSSTGAETAVSKSFSLSMLVRWVIGVGQSARHRSMVLRSAG